MRVSAYLLFFYSVIVSAQNTPTVETPDPSPEPTVEPSVTPSFNPSPAPSRSPSASPSQSPTYAPSPVPSIEPSSLPSFEPSPLPSNIPSLFPTIIQTPLPSVVPSALPSGPTRIPSAIPTGPTRIPSAAPTGPSRNPSALPTNSPNLAGTANPTKYPTYNPTFKPTGPTFEPTPLPTTNPTPFFYVEPTGPTPEPTTPRPTPIRHTQKCYTGSTLYQQAITDCNTDIDPLYNGTWFCSKIEVCETGISPVRQCIVTRGCAYEEQCVMDPMNGTFYDGSNLLLNSELPAGMDIRISCCRAYELYPWDDLVAFDYSLICNSASRHLISAMSIGLVTAMVYILAMQ